MDREDIEQALELFAARVSHLPVSRVFVPAEVVTELMCKGEPSPAEILGTVDESDTPGGKG